MSNLIQTFLQADVALSARLTLVADVLCAIGGLAVVAAVVTRRGAIRRGASPSRAVTSLPITFLVATMLTMFAVVLARWNEVNHFPSQTMSEVLTMFSTALAVSMVVLNFALGLQRRGGGWAILNDVLILLVLAGVFGTHAWIRGLSTAQRDLPPALQSYWFPWHLSALIFSYATMSIAAFVCLLFFVTRFWSGVFLGGQSKKSQWLTAAALVLIPFVHVVTLPILALSGIVFWILLKSGKLPQGAELAKLEKTFDDVSFRTFAVGFPFLTAGVWMGAFWAQEAWANYWGWDSKENSALITWLVYVVYIHLRMLGGYRGAKAMSVLVGGAVSVFLTFQLFGYLPDSQKSLHRYTDDGVTPQEGQAGPAPAANEQASLEAPRTDRAMSAALIDGKKIAADVRAEVKRGAQGLIARGVQPGLAVVLVGDDPASRVYVRNKDKAAREAGFAVRTLELPATVAQADLERVVRELNADRSVHGILVQLPLPRGLDARAVVDLIDPSKDVDGLTPANVAALVQGRAGHRPCTPLGCLVLLDRTDVPLEGRHVVVIGRSLLVGKPFALMALERNATVTVAHSRTRDLAALVVQADVVVAAVGRAGLVRGAWIRPGAVVLDVGINRGPDGRLAGDVEFEAASQRAAAITPVPGGVGPMTIALLLSNTLAAAQSLSPASP